MLFQNGGQVKNEHPAAENLTGLEQKLCSELRASHHSEYSPFEQFYRYWCPHHDSNVELLLRTELFYPLNYRGSSGRTPAFHFTVS